MKKNDHMQTLLSCPANRKERGEWVELLFMAAAARRGLKVVRPHGDSARFDVIVAAGGALHRVQVRSTTSRSGRFYRCCCSFPLLKPSVNGRLRRSMQRYSRQDIDFLAAYIIPDDAWFIIPVIAITAKTILLPTPAYCGRSRYTLFLDAWHLLGASPARLLTIHASAERKCLRYDTVPGATSNAQ